MDTPSTVSKREIVLTRRKQFFFYAFSVALSFILLGTVELSLRFFGYGPNLSLFVSEKIGGRTFHVLNPDVKARYFSKVDFSPNTSPDYFLVPKPAGAFRIFCLGGSTTAGFPYGFVGSFSTFMRDRLQTLFPGKNVEVINLGLTATNSYTVVDMARELGEFEPDLFVVYDGHNEFYGALGSASNETISTSHFVSTLYLRLIHFKTFLLFRDAYDWLRTALRTTESGESSGTMMERMSMDQYVPYKSESYLRTLEAYKANLQALREIAEKLNIRVILGAQVSNLRDMPPFISRDSEGLSVNRRLEFTKKYNQGLSDWMDGEFARALTSYESAAKIDSLRADVNFEIARCLDTLGRRKEAYSFYVRARDYDQLRFRMSTDFNEAMREASDNKTLFYSDIERKFRANSPDSLIGNGLILEHLHPNERGYFLLAKEFVWTMHLNKILASEDEWNERNVIDDDLLWDNRVATELDRRAADRRIEILTSGWPFKSSIKMSPPFSSNDPVDRIADELVAGRITWEQAHVEAAQYFIRRGDKQAAVKEYLALINQVPFNVSAYLLLSQLYVEMKNYADASEILRVSLVVEPTFFAYRLLGSLSLDLGDPREATYLFSQAMKLSTNGTERNEIDFLLALSHERAGKRTDAIRVLQELLQHNPNMQSARDLLERITVVRP